MKLFDGEYYHDFEMWARGHSRSLKMAPFDRPYTTFYWSTIVSISLSSTIFELLPPTKEAINVFARVYLSVCLLARLLKNSCMDLDEMLRVDICRDMDEQINFWARSGLYPDAGTGLLSPLSYKRCYTKFYIGKIPRISTGAAQCCSEAWF